MSDTKARIERKKIAIEELCEVADPWPIAWEIRDERDEISVAYAVKVGNEGKVYGFKGAIGPTATESERDDVKECLFQSLLASAARRAVAAHDRAIERQTGVLASETVSA